MPSGLANKFLVLAIPPIMSLLMVAGVENYTLIRQDVAEQRVQREHRIASAVLSLKALYAEARLAVELIRRERSEEAERVFRGRQGEAARVLASVQTALPGQSSAVFEELRERDQSLNRNFEVYTAALKRLGRGDRDGLNGEVLDANLDLRDSITSHISALGRWHEMADGLARRLALIEHDYRQTEQLRQLQFHHDAIDRMKAMLIAAELPAQAADSINGRLDSYGAKFADWVDVSQYALNVFNRIHADHILLNRGLQTLLETAELRGQEASAHRAAIEAQRRLWLYVTLFGVVFAAVWLANMLNRRYGAPAAGSEAAPAEPPLEIVEVAVAKSLTELEQVSKAMRDVTGRIGQSAGAPAAEPHGQPKIA